MHAVITAGLVSTITLFSPPEKPLTPERIQELVKKLEEKGPHEPYLNGLLIQSPSVFELGKAGPDLVPTLIAIYGNKKSSSAARAHSACALSMHLNGFFTIPDPRIVRVLKAAMKDEDPIVRRGVQVSTVNWYRVEPGFLNLREQYPKLPSLHSITFPVATFRMFLPEVVAGLRDPNSDSASLMAIKLYLFAEAGVGVKELIEATKRPEPEVRAAAVLALGRVGFESSEALDVVLGLLAMKDEPKTFLGAVCAVGWFGAKAKAAVPTLTKVVESSEFKWYLSNDLYVQAIVSLGQIGPDAKKALPAVQQYIFVGGHSTPQQLIMIDALEKIDLKAGTEARAKYQKIIDDFKNTGGIAVPPIIPAIPFVPFPKPR